GFPTNTTANGGSVIISLNPPVGVSSASNLTNYSGHLATFSIINSSDFNPFVLKYPAFTVAPYDNSGCSVFIGGINNNYLDSSVNGTFTINSNVNSRILNNGSTIIQFFGPSVSYTTDNTNINISSIIQFN